ncbi:uncharacterized protein TRUGW13939_04306 [Talaromyces rugulosus]|uniref:Phosphotransferase n=1 Tax=Talaromyces rugulosus TaxID=121627 RepID=A0A7H8QTS9_TALRU|nr:uncharacterized protein TRUGW13939_04306 [Talaromyces rugulosus]QKX57198.1 hypothetical protein TRUGW13939_04306 [Talaromyces rugulosus]
MEDHWDDIPRQAWRAFRKKLGLPASSDVKILSELVKELLTLAPSSLPYTIISYPGIIALYSEDIIDTAEYLGLRKLQGYYTYHLREIVAAYSGHGMGLCRHFENKDQCENESSQLPDRVTLLVEYTEQALLLQTSVLREAIDLGGTYILAAASFELGGNSQMAGHACRVAEFVDQFLRKWYQGQLIPEEILVIITGNLDDSVREAIQEAVKGLVAKVQLTASQSEYVAARGAAELAWRANILDKSM